MLLNIYKVENRQAVFIGFQSPVQLMENRHYYVGTGFFIHNEEHDEWFHILEDGRAVRTEEPKLA